MLSLEERQAARKAAREAQNAQDDLTALGTAVLRNVTAIERDGTVVKAGPHAEPAPTAGKGKGKAEPVDPGTTQPPAPPPAAAGAPVAPSFTG